MIDWLKNALSTVYTKDGLIGIAVVAALLAGVVFLLWFLKIDPSVYF
jgi:hypothetical protein